MLVRMKQQNADGAWLCASEWSSLY